MRSFQSLAAVSGWCVFLGGVVRDVDGQAQRITSYLDEACQEPQSQVLTFGAPDFTQDPPVLGEFNECVATEGSGIVTVCDSSTGLYGLDIYGDDTCSADSLIFEGAVLPNCTVTSLDGVCEEGLACAVMSECTDDVPSTISPNAFNYVATEYNGPNCTEPTGVEDAVVSADVFLAGSGDGTCFEIAAGFGWGYSECMADGTITTQTFAPDDTTCSLDVWTESMSFQAASTICSFVEVDGLYYSITACTEDAATVGTDGTSPTVSPTDGMGDETPSPNTDGDRDVMTMSPTTPDGGFGGETSSPSSADDVEGSGAVGAGNGVAFGTFVMTCVVGLLAFGAM